MSYQFDPTRKGLQYEPLKVSFSPKPIWFLRDEPNAEPLVDLKSLCAATGMAWAQKWKMYCVARETQWSLMSCYDHQLNETMLARSRRLPAILAEILPLLQSHPSAWLRVNKLLETWRFIHAELMAQVKPNKTDKGKTLRQNSGPRRKVSPYVVQQIFTLINKKRAKHDIAKALNISADTLKKIVNGTYAPLDEESKAAWWNTFGAAKTPAARQNPGINS